MYKPIQLALQSISVRLRGDRFATLNESEFQSLLYLELCDRLTEEMSVTIPEPVIFPAAFRHMPIRRRVFREMVLDPKAGRSSPRPDLLIFAPEPLVALPKQNGAISSWQGQHEQLVETKFNKRAREAAIDQKKYPPTLHHALTCINFNPSGQSILEGELAVDFGGSGKMRKSFKPHRNVEHCIREAIAAVHAMHCAAPATMIREKDFESWLVRELERRLGIDGCELVEGGHDVGSTTGVRSQLSTTLMPQRRHDILVTDRMEVPHRLGKLQAVHSASAEIEIKTSHSESHNWFDGRLEPELQKMTEFHRKFGGIPFFVMFRFGDPIFVRDYQATVQRHRSVRFLYLCTNGQVL